ncbi:DOLPP1 [Bugula neritina]|uniref:Dolichyldiphosphatase n=1 Tax=Bugula neritina TaxID=10212 RepID=A0A7J7KAI6_BUGNE|nr:DOLPP1 [Bugula neritina]
MEESREVWKSLSLTHVQYLEGDVIGFILAWSSMLPIFIFVSIVTLVLFRRDLHTVCFGAGLLLNEVLNKILKRVIAEPRPVASHRPTNALGYRMPSDHSQYMAFFSVYVTLFLCIRSHSTGACLERIWKLILVTGVMLSAAACCYSRYYLLYHTPAQIYWGILVGVLTGILWFCMVHLILTPYFPQITTWKVSEFLMIRDYTLIPNTLWFEYCHARAEARSRLRKQKSRAQ